MIGKENNRQSKISNFSHMIRVIEGINAEGRILDLDIGCQAGGLLEYLNGRFAERYEVDIGNYNDYWGKIEGCSFQIVDIDKETLPFADSYFDIVTCIMVLEHVFDVFNAMSELSRVTRPNGFVIIEVPNISYFKHIFSLIL